MAVVQAKPITTCILCEQGEVNPFLSLGNQPLPNRLPALDDPPDDVYRLEVGYCDHCGHVQLAQVVSPEDMFEDYSYVPSTSEFLRNHFRELAATATRRIGPAEHSLVVDIGGNDGLLLSYFQDEHKLFGINVDPAKNLAEVAGQRGVSTLVAFFNESAAEAIVSAHGKAKIITANNCMAHTAQLAPYLRGVEKLLADDGVFIVENPYLWSLVRNLQFDTIYHEHQSYLAVRPLWEQLPRYGLRLDGCDYMSDVHGGSMRYWITKSTSRAPILGAKPPTYHIAREPWQSQLSYHLNEFAANVGARGDRIREAIENLDGTVMGIGASAKCAVTLNFCKPPGREWNIAAISDANPRKQGRRIPGVGIPIVPEDNLEDADHVINFIWNLKSDVEKKVALYAPEAEVVELP